MGGDTPEEAAAIIGQVINNATGAPIPNATIAFQDVSGSSNSEGQFSIAGTSVAERVVMTVTAPGFAPQSRIISIDSLDERTPVDAVLMSPVDGSSSFNPATEQTLTVEDSPAQVELPANSLASEDGSAPVGNVTADITVIDPALDPDLMPGDFTVEDASGTPVDGLLESFGAITVELTDSQGTDMDLTDGNTSTIRIPVPQGESNAPSTIPLYYFNEESGRWVQEGTATLSDDRTYYAGTVEHFSTWNADRLYDVAYIEGQVVDTDEQPVVGAQVKSEGVDYRGSARARTDAEGLFRVAVKAGAAATVSATKNGISSNSQIVSPTPAVDQESAPVTLIIGSNDSTATIKLTWGENPRDLDSHLRADLDSGQDFHIWYSNKGALTTEPYVNLDVDDTTSFGPEIITINQFENGTYTYYIVHYSGSSDISNSDARVELKLDDTTRIYTPPAGAEGRSGEQWQVFELVVQDQTVTINNINEIRDYATTEGSTEDHHAFAH